MNVLKNSRLDEKIKMMKIKEMSHRNHNNKSSDKKMV